MERHRERLAHEELVGAWITCAVKNHSMAPPKEPANPIDYMPSHRQNAAKVQSRRPELTEEELERQSDWNLRVAEKAAELRAQHGL